MTILRTSAIALAVALVVEITVSLPSAPDFADGCGTTIMGGDVIPNYGSLAGRARSTARGPASLAFVYQVAQLDFGTQTARLDFGAPTILPDFDDLTATPAGVQAVPEPSMLALGGLAMGCLALARRLRA